MCAARSAAIHGVKYLSDSIICPSVCPVVRRNFAIFVSVLISSVGVQRSNAFIPTLGSEGPQWGLGKIIYLSVSLSLYLYVSLPGHPSRFLAINSRRP